ncbi:MAG TPA: hypothetical protein PK250_15170 [Syntrophobacter fumaroxidans]|nr:hypothetical protein [Syntrophobacter fumaroxidans]
MKDIGLIFISIFAAGIVSLLLELSLLREFIYIFGSTAVSNAIIISVFLVGLAFGAYLGTWRKLGVRDENDARRRFAFIQLLSILFIILFFLSKKYFIYHSHHQNLVRFYFIVSVFAPSLLSGLAYAISVKIMHWRGEKYITYIYAFSTLGSVIGGLAHGIVLVPLWGIRSAYICAVLFAGVALYTMYPLMSMMRKFVTAAVVVLAVAAIHLDFADVLFPSESIVFSKDSEFGIVEVWKLNEADARTKHLALGGKDGDFRLDEPPIDLKVNNIHQSYNLPIDRLIHEQWAQTSLGIVNRVSNVLLLGYGSGVTAAAYLSSPMVGKLDIVENCMPVIEAAEMFFPREYELALQSKKSNFIVDDFRGFVRFTKERYDIIALDHSIEDPYAIGFFTLEFFDQLKRITRPGGVVLLLGKGTSWNTTRLSFKHVYRNIDPRINSWLRKGCLYLAQEEFQGVAARDYETVRDGLSAEEPVYSDEEVQQLAEYQEDHGKALD